MARTPCQKDRADRIIGAREQSLLDALRASLNKKGWSTALNTKLRRGSRGEIDLLAVNWHFPEEVLVVEAKACLEPDDFNELRSVTSEMIRGQGQLRQAVVTLKAMDVAERARLFSFVEWDKVRHWYSLIVTPEAEPGFDYDHSEIPACSLGTLYRQTHASDWKSPFRLWRAIVERKWQAQIRDGERDFEVIELAGKRFEIPLRVTGGRRETR
jgi:hypothetical protein